MKVWKTELACTQLMSSRVQACTVSVGVNEYAAPTNFCKIRRGTGLTDLVIMQDLWGHRNLSLWVSLKSLSLSLFVQANIHAASCCMLHMYVRIHNDISC